MQTAYHEKQSMAKSLCSFHHMVARYVIGCMPHKEGNGWVYPPIAEVLEEVVMFTIQLRSTLTNSGTIL